MENLTFEITDVQIFDYYCATTDTYSYSCNIQINKLFCIQTHSKNDEFTVSIPYSEECFWGDEKDQDYAAENYDANEIERHLNEKGHELNDHYLYENFGALIMNPEFSRLA